MSIGEKLDPRRFTAMSGKMAALVAFVLGDKALFSTAPRIVQLVVTSDGGLLARHEGDIGANDFIGGVADYENNWNRLIAVADLTKAEERWLRLRLKSTLTDFRQTH